MKAKAAIVPNGKLHAHAVELPPNTILSDSNRRKYRVGHQFATGGFGRIYTCNEVDSDTELAVKVEPQGNGPLFTEMNVFIRIFKPEHITAFMKSRNLKRLGVPPLISSGVFTHGEGKLRFLVIPKYATSLEEMRKKTKTLPSHGVWTVARCMLESLEYIHEKDYVHADIKAANILLEREGDFSSSVLADFGLARLSSNNDGKPDKKRAHNGTAIFTSCDAHRGCHPSYRGDLEILAYNMVYWLSGSLPWEGDEANPSKVYASKQAFSKNPADNLKKLLQNNLESVAPLQKLFSIAYNTDYLDHLNFSKLYEIVDEALKRVDSGVRKRIANVCEDDTSKAKKAKTSRSDDGTSEAEKAKISRCEDDTSKAKKAKISTRGKRGTSSKERKYSKDQKGCENTVEDAAPTTSHQIRFRKKFLPTSPTPHQNVIRRQSPRIRVENRAAESLPSPPRLARQTPSVTARDRRRAAANHVLPVPEKRSKKLSSGEVIPGLSVRRAPGSQLNEESSQLASNDDTTSGTPTEKNGKRPTQKVSSDIKRSPTKLRKIPGMMNFQRGRRSFIIDKITKKYQRIALKKREVGDG